MKTQNPNHQLLQRSRQPIYLQLSTEFKSKIDKGEWAFNSQIPSLDTLVNTYGVSRMTLRQALTVLVEDGYVERSRGKGTFVRRKPPSVFELQLPTTWDETVALSDLLGTESITESDQPAMQLPPLCMKHQGVHATSYQYLCRVHTKDGVPYCYSEVYIASSVYEKHAALFKQAAVASALNKIPNLHIEHAHQKLKITQANLESANALHINAGDYVAEIRRTASANNELIYFARLEFPTDFVKLEIDLIK